VEVGTGLGSTGDVERSENQTVVRRAHVVSQDSGSDEEAQSNDKTAANQAVKESFLEGV
jgi:hypothetical protein